MKFVKSAEIWFRAANISLSTMSVCHKIFGVSLNTPTSLLLVATNHPIAPLVWESDHFSVDHGLEHTDVSVGLFSV